MRRCLMRQPKGHRVIVKLDSVETVSAGGILLQGSIDERLEKAGIQLGIVVAYGDQAWKAFSTDFTGKPWANVGDYIFFARYAGKILIDPIDGEDYMIMNDEDILAVIEEGSNTLPDNKIKLKEEEVDNVG